MMVLPFMGSREKQFWPAVRIDCENMKQRATNRNTTYSGDEYSNLRTEHFEIQPLQVALVKSNCYHGQGSLIIQRSFVTPWH